MARGLPDLTIRSTFIVGFPGETDEDFQQLLDWLEEAELDRVGCFKYEAVEGAAANKLATRVPEGIKEERWHQFMQKQAEISAGRLKKKVGRTFKVLIDEVHEDGAVGRSYADAPEIDGLVHVKAPGKLKAGDIVPVKITKSDEYDLFGSVIPK